MWVWSSFASLSISRITSSERPNSIIVFSEPRVTDKSIVNVFILLLSTPLLELFCRVEFFATFFLPVPVTVWPALPDVEVRDRGKDPARTRCTSCFLLYHLARSVHTGSRRCQTSQNIRHALHCDFGSTSTISHNSVFPAAVIASFDSSLKGLNARLLLKITLKCFSLRVVLDLVNQVVNVDAM